MAFGLSPAGTITKQATGIVSTRRIGVADATNISKGSVVVVSATGFVQTASDADEGNFFVAIEPANNTSGSDGDISVPLAVGGHYVTVVADAEIFPGRRVKISATDAGEVVPVAEGTDAEELVVGTYWGKEGGIIAKSTTSADDFEESFTDDADFVPVAAAADDVIEIELKK